MLKISYFRLHQHEQEYFPFNYRIWRGFTRDQSSHKKVVKLYTRGEAPAQAQEHMMCLNLVTEEFTANKYSCLELNILIKLDLMF